MRQSDAFAVDLMRRLPAKVSYTEGQDANFAPPSYQAKTKHRVSMKPKVKYDTVGKGDSVEKVKYDTV